MLLPVTVDGEVKWKIWSLSTWLLGLRDFPEDESLLRVPSDRSWCDKSEIKTQVLVVGGGNS